MVDKYPFIEFEFSKHKFYSPVTPNFLTEKEKYYKDIEIKYIYSNFFVLTNYNKKILYLLLKYNDTYYLKGKFNYFTNIITRNEFIFFDDIKKGNLTFRRIDLLNNKLDEKNELNDIFYFKISYNIPKIISLNNTDKFLLLYEDNQISIIDYNISNNIDNKEKAKNEKDKKSDKDTKNENINKTPEIPESIKEINIKKIGPLIPEVVDHSAIYSDSYEPSNLFINNSDYYCSYSDNPKHFIEFDFKEEYNFTYFKVICYEKETRCRPKNYNMILYDDKKRIINTFEFTGIKENSSEIKYLGERGRYIKLNFKENFSGSYFILKNIEFYANDEII